MANKDVNKELNTAEAEQEKAPKKSFFRRMITLTLILAVVLVVAVVTTMKDGNYFASLRRWLMYGDSSQTQNLYTYASDPANLYGQMGEDLLVVSPNAIRLLKEDGTTLYDLSVSMTAPHLTVGSATAAVCDVGSSMLYVLDEVGIARTLTTEAERCFYTARLNSQDILTTVSQKTGYKSSVSVYDKAGEMLFQFDSYENYISDAVVTEDGKYLLAVAMEPKNGAFGSTLMTYDLSTAELVRKSAVPDGLVLDMAVNEGRIITLCDRRLAITGEHGQLLLNHAYDNLYLHGSALTGGDFCALLLGRYQSGNVYELTTFDLGGQTIASTEITEEVLDLSACGEYLAVLYSNSLVIYTRDLAEHARLEGTDYAGHVRMEEDGTALVIAGSSAWRFLP